jgi:two-component system, NtrC family, response regulator AtoC
MSSGNVLVVDDDATFQGYLQDVLCPQGYAVSCLDSGHQVLDRLRNMDRPSVVLLDLLMPRSDGMEVLGRIRDSSQNVPVIVMSAIDQTRSVVRAMRMGAADYLVKPVEEDELAESVRAAISLNRSPVKASAEYAEDEPRMSFGAASCDSRMARIRDLAGRVADTDVPVLILGETGVGKEVLAQYLHSVSNRHSAPFVKVNCAAVPADLLESELFGYERGAFTGALRDKPGKFELAGQGTLLLDEIGEMSPLLQAKLLHVLQDGECYRLGGTKPIRIGARVLASTNRCLEEAVAKGDFRQDLFFRLNVVRLEIPPLRARAGDIPRLVDAFMTKYSERYDRPPVQVPPELMDAFNRYSWPGNVRQLENAIRRFVVVPEVELAMAELARTGSSVGESADPAGTSLREKAAFAADQTERQLVLRTLEEVNWNRKAAAKRLGICYKSLLNKLRRWQIPGRSGSVPSEDLE